MRTSLLLSLITSAVAVSAASPVIVAAPPSVGTNTARVTAPGTFSRPQTTFQNPIAPTIPVTGTFSRPQSTFSSQSGTFSRPEGTFSRPEEGTFARPETTFSRPQGTFSPLETTFSRPPTTFEQPLTSPAPIAAPQQPNVPAAGATVAQPTASKVIVFDLPPGAVIRKPAATQP